MVFLQFWIKKGKIREGNEIIRKASKWSLELAAACEVWKEICLPRNGYFVIRPIYINWIAIKLGPIFYLKDWAEYNQDTIVFYD